MKYLSATEEGNNTCTKVFIYLMYYSIVLLFCFNLGANFDDFIPTVLVFSVSFFFSLTATSAYFTLILFISTTRGVIRGSVSAFITVNKLKV